MNTFISASSPLFEYRPCKACNTSTGFQSGSDFTGRDYNGTESGMITQTGETTVQFNCTGSGISFDISYSQPSDSSFTPSLIVNGSSPDTSKGIRANGTSISNLPLGRHTFELTFSRNSSSSSSSQEEWVRVNGANCNIGYQMNNNQTITDVIDDTAWRDWKVYLTPGWNMLEAEGVSNYIDLDQYQAELPNSSRDYNGSISWTEQVNAANEIHFQGSAVWVHGIIGDEAGTFEVVLDNITQGVYNASGGPRIYNSILYHTSDLADTSHSILLRNLEQGKRLSFDRLVSMSGLTRVANYSSTPLPTSSSAPSSSVSQVEVSSFYPTPTGHNSQQENIPTSLSGGAIAGIVIAASIVIAAFLITWIFAFLRKRQDQKKNEQIESDGERDQREKSQTTFFRFSSRAPSPTPGHPFHPLPSPKHPQPQAKPLVAQQQSQHPIPTPRKPTTSRLFNFSSPTPSLRSFIQNHTTSSMVSEKDGRGTSFLKLNNNRFSRSKNHQRNDSTAGSEILTPQGQVYPGVTKKSIAGLNIGNPQALQVQRDDSQDYLPSLASHTREVPVPKSAPGPVPTPMIFEEQSTPRKAPLPPTTQGEYDNPPSLPVRSDSIASSSTGGRRETISPLVAALSGMTSSPLAELSRSASKKLTSPLSGAGGIFARRKATNDDHDRNRNFNADSQNTKRESKFGAGSIKTAKTEFEDGDGETEGGEGILTMYANFPPGPPSQRNTAFDYSPRGYDEEEGAGQDNISGVGVALGSPMQDNNFQWEGNARSQPLKDEELFKPPTRRFLGLGDRPKSGVSNKSGKTVSSVGSGWRYM